MLKGFAKMADGRGLIVLGISQVNVDRLQKGEPISFDPGQLHIVPGTAIGGITLFYGATDAELMRTVKTLIGPQTEMISVPRGDAKPS